MRRLRIDAPEPSPPDRGKFQFRAAQLTVELIFRELDVVQDRLWLSTYYHGIVVIDPVSESWTRLELEPVPTYPGQVATIFCGSDVWLQLANGVALLDLETQTFQMSGEEQGLPVLRDFERLVACGEEGLWVYLPFDKTLFQVAASGVVHERYEILPFMLSNNFDVVESAQWVCFLDPSGYMPGLFLFDPRTLSLEQVGLPGGATGESLERTEEGLLVRTRDSKTFLMRAESKSWVEVPDVRTPGDAVEAVLAEGDGVVWVGASYDVSAGSYFVLRYIRDASEPKDLVVMQGQVPWIRRAVVPYLGMLWTVSGRSVLRIDPVAEEIVSYELGTDPAHGGIPTYLGLTKKSFRLEKGELQRFDGQALWPAVPEERDPGDESKR